MGDLLATLEANFNPSWLTLTPLALMAYLALRRVTAESTMFLTSAYAMVPAMGLQGTHISEVMAAIYQGAPFNTGQASVDALFD